MLGETWASLADGDDGDGGGGGGGSGGGGGGSGGCDSDGGGGGGGRGGNKDVVANATITVVQLVGTDPTGGFFAQVGWGSYLGLGQGWVQV